MTKKRTFVDLNTGRSFYYPEVPIESTPDWVVTTEDYHQWLAMLEKQKARAALIGFIAVCVIMALGALISKM